MKCKPVDKSFNIRYKLSDKTLEYISKTTKLSNDELTNLSLKEQVKLMESRRAIKKTNPIKTFFIGIYKKLGEKLGLREKEYNIYTDID